MDLEELKARLAKLTSLSDTQLSQFSAQIVAGFDLEDAEPATVSTVKSMKALSAANDLVEAEHKRRADSGALTTTTTHLTDTPAAFNSTSGGNGGGRPASKPGPANGIGRGMLSDRFKNEIHDRDQLASALTAAVADARSGGKGMAFTANWKNLYGEDRRLTNDAFHDTAVLDSHQRALTASGGIAAPIAADYAVEGIAVADRPIRAGLPGYLADRGGVRFVNPVQLAATTGATSIWTAATDAAPSGATKARLTVNCPNENSVLVDAVPTRLLLGNFLSRFDPEWAENFVNTTMAAAARTAELNLLSKIAAGSTSVSSGQLLGASRDFLATVDQVVAAVRYRQRAGDTAPITVILPSWAKNMFRADLAREFAGADPLAIPDSAIDAYLNTRHVTAIWLLDGLPATSGSASRIAFPSQQFGTQPAGTGLLDWPHQLVWHAFPTGTWQYLDGGMLNVGVVRDSMLDATNDLEIFSEVFESTALGGLESLQIVSALRPNGASAAGIDTSTY